MQLSFVFGGVLASVPVALSAAECLLPTVHFPSDGPAEYTVPDADEAALRSREYGAAPSADHLLVVHDGDGYWVPRAELDAAQVAKAPAAEPEPRPKATLTGPDSAQAGQVVEIAWEAPGAEGDWVGTLALGADVGAFSSRIGIDHGKGFLNKVLSDQHSMGCSPRL